MPIEISTLEKVSYSAETLTRVTLVLPQEVSFILSGKIRDPIPLVTLCPAHNS